ncbi:MAG: hypothetical protein M3Y49_13590, partial [Actinomycetota bacterium]|nr:hypothetical protein [Actinomycetota bacterium]
MSHPVPDNAPTPPSPIAPAAPGTGARLMGLLTDFLASLDAWPGAWFQLSEADLGDVVSNMLTVVCRAENVAVLTTAEALTR